MAIHNPIIQRVGRFYVLRDDLYPGGTKSHILSHVIEKMPQHEFVYAADPRGVAGYALACACAQHDRAATIFFPPVEVGTETDIYMKTLDHPNAMIKVMYDTANQMELYQKACIYAQKHSMRYAFPVGFSMPAFQKSLMEYAQSLTMPGGEKEPKEVWALAGSGGLVRSLRAAWPSADINAVSMGFSHLDVGQGLSHVFNALEAPHEKALKPPPFSSAPYYDAKVWRYVEENAQDDALMWNVA